jgi:sirohydrochlorin cobaltochelatase
VTGSLHPAAILLVAFGTSVRPARAAYDRIEVLARQRFPDRMIRQAYTSKTVRGKLRDAGETIHSPEEALAALANEKTRAVVLQSLHVTPGQEFNALRNLAAPSGMTIALGDPLLAGESDLACVATAVERANPALDDPTASVVLVAHGNERFPEYNDSIIALASRLREDRSHVFLATIEGPPGNEAFPEITIQARSAGRVHFIPLMIVAGDHVMNDVMGDGPESWRNRIGAKQATCAPPLGASDEIAGIFLDHCEHALRRIESCPHP